MQKKNSQYQKGFTLFISLVVVSTLLLISSGIIALAVRQSLISSSGRESQIAFYAADSGMECALYWDAKNPGGGSAFSSEEETVIQCNLNAENPDNEWTVGGAETSVIPSITYEPFSHCASVTVTKGLDGSTTIESRGYNTCNPLNPRRVERAVRVVY